MGECDSSGFVATAPSRSSLRNKQSKRIALTSLKRIIANVTIKKVSYLGGVAIPEC